MKKLMLVLMLLFAFILPQYTEASTFSGHSSFSHNLSAGSHTASSFPSSQTYHSGYKTASANVNRTSVNLHNTQPSFFKKFLTHAAAFGAGAYLGNTINSLGGHYFGAHGLFGTRSPIFGILFDILFIAMIVWVIKKIFSMRSS